MKTNAINQNWEQVFDVIQNSFSIEKHLDFYNWLQKDVRKIIKHDILIGAWGDFATGDLNFDVSSNIDEIRTQKLIDAPGVFSYLMTRRILQSCAPQIQLAGKKCWKESTNCQLVSWVLLGMWQQLV